MNDEGAKQLKETLGIILDLATNDLLDFEQACKEIERRAASALGLPPPDEGA